LKTNIMNSSLLLILCICSVSCVKISTKHHGTPYDSNIAESSANSKDFLKDCKIFDVDTNNLIADCGTERKIIDLKECLLVGNDGRMRIMGSKSITNFPLRKLDQCVNCKVNSKGDYKCDCKTSDEKNENTNIINLNSLIGWDKEKKEMLCESTRGSFKNYCKQEYTIHGGNQLKAEITCSDQKYIADLSVCLTLDKYINIYKRDDPKLPLLTGRYFPRCGDCRAHGTNGDWGCQCYFDQYESEYKIITSKEISDLIGFDTKNKKTFCM
jgi:hypothetical protein